MPSFENAYFIPNVGSLINNFMRPEDDIKIDSTSKSIREFHREWVYPGYRHMNIDDIYENASSSRAALAYMTKMNPYVEEIECFRNVHGVKLPRLRSLPNLQDITFAVPIILDVTLRRIHPNTQELWRSVNMFINAAVTQENSLQKISIVPGVIVLVRTDPVTNEYLEEHVLEDMTEGSHLQIFRRYGLPVVLHAPMGARHIDIKIPLQLASWVTKNGGFTDWSVHETGIASVLLDLID